MYTKRLLIVICMFGLFLGGCGAVDEKQAERILSGAAQTTIAGVTYVPETPKATLDVNLIVKQTLEAMTAQAGGNQSQPTPIPSAASTTGSISGQLNYPASAIPAMYVTAFQVGTQNYQYVISNPGQTTYKIDGLQPGVYHVIAYTIGGGGFPAGLSGGYSKAVPCGLNVNCTDHTLIDVTVGAGQTAGSINPFDWYAPAGTFPAFPQQAASPTLAPTLPPAAATGGISGTLMYPAGGVGMPSLRIVAFQVGAPNYFHVDTALGQNKYELDNLPPGTYRVLAYTLAGGGFNPGPIGGYSQMVPCGLQYGCNDHTLIDVVVTAGHVTAGVDPNDYYAPEGTFPPNPVP